VPLLSALKVIYVDALYNLTFTLLTYLDYHTIAGKQPTVVD